eukprot:gene15156-21223_t
MVSMDRRLLVERSESGPGPGAVGPALIQLVLVLWVLLSLSAVGFYLPLIDPVARELMLIYFQPLVPINLMMWLWALNVHDFERQHGPLVPQGAKTPLHLAAEGGHAEAVQVLLDSGAEVNASDFSGWCPLHCVCYFGDVACAKLLLASGADPSLSTDFGQGPLLVAAGACGINTAKDARQPSLSTDFGQGPLHVAAEASGMQWCGDRTSDYAELVRILVAAGCEPNCRDAGGQPVIVSAAKEGGTAVVQALCELGADPNAKSESSPCAAALHMAAAEGYMSTLNILSTAGADMNVMEEGGMTPLHVAVRAGQVEMAVALIKMPGVNIWASDLSGLTPLHLAASDGAMPIVNAILEASIASPDAAGANLAGGCTPSAPITPLHLAAHAGHADVAQALLSHYGGLEYVNALDTQKQTALMAASKSGSAQVVSLLMQAGTDAAMLDGQGRTAAQVAEASGHFDVVSAIANAASNM